MFKCKNCKYTSSSRAELLLHKVNCRTSTPHQNLLELLDENLSESDDHLEVIIPTILKLFVTVQTTGVVLTILLNNY